MPERPTLAARGGITRLLVTATGFLREDGEDRTPFLRWLDELMADAYDITWLPEADLPRVAEWIARAHPDVIVSIGSTQTVSILAADAGLPVVAWGYAGALVDLPTPDLCGFCLPADTQRESLRVLQTLLPDLREVAALYDERYPPGRIALTEARAAAEELGLALVVCAAQDETGLDAAFTEIAHRGIRGIRVMLSPFLAREAGTLARRALAVRAALMSYDRTTREGGLVSYVPDMTRTAALLADLAREVARGREPRDFGVRPCPMKLELNAATARALGVAIPPELARRATRIYD